MIVIRTTERGRNFQSGDAQVFVPSALLDEVWLLKFTANVIGVKITQLISALDAHLKDCKNA